MNPVIYTSPKAPYLIFIGDVDSTTYAKTGLGLVQWCREQIAGQLRFTGNELDLGVPDMSVAQAIEAGAKSLIIGVAPVGGILGPHWEATLIKAAADGLDIVSGLHTRLEEISGLSEAALSSNARLLNVRIPPPAIPIANGKKRTGRRVLTVGTDCAVGKKYTALALAQSLHARSIKATFRATGQTGIMIAGSGIPIDAVVSDFVAGAAELISPANAFDHWDVIEGQGSLFHPSYAGVSLGLLHGSQADAIVLCHDATRHYIDSCPQIPIPSIKDCIDMNLRCGRLTNPNIICLGISVNTSRLPKEKRNDYLKALAKETGLPCVDSVIDSCDAIADNLLHHFQANPQDTDKTTSSEASQASEEGSHA